MSKIKLIMNNSTYTLPLSRAILNKIPEDKEYICNQLMSDHQYQVQSSVPNEIFQSFLDYWENGTIPQIDFSNIWYYYTLKDEFGILSDHLSSPEYQSLFDLAYLTNMNQNPNLNKSHIEKRIAHNLDSYLSNQSDKLCRIPINSLYNIFNHPERNLTEYDRAYHFIVDNGRNVDESFFILLGSLDAGKFRDQENKRDAFIGRMNHLGFEPRNADNFVLDIDQQLQNCRQQIEQQRRSLIEANQKIEQLEANQNNANQNHANQNNANQNKVILYKIVVVGDSSVGKSTILKRLVEEKFYEDIHATIGVEIFSYSLKAGNENVKLQIWDTAGLERFRSIATAYFRHAVGAVLVFDLTNSYSFKTLNKWINEITSLCAPNAYIVLVGNKNDLEGDRKVTEAEAQEFARRNNILYLETSAKTGSNIKVIFERLAQGITNRIKENIIKIDQLPGNS